MIKELDLKIKNAGMLLQIAILMNIDTKYAGIMLTIELKWKNRTTNLKNTILRLVKYKAI